MNLQNEEGRDRKEERWQENEGLGKEIAGKDQEGKGEMLEGSAL